MGERAGGGEDGGLMPVDFFGEAGAGEDGIVREHGKDGGVENAFGGGNKGQVVEVGREILQELGDKLAGNGEDHEIGTFEDVAECSVVGFVKEADLVPLFGHDAAEGGAITAFADDGDDFTVCLLMHMYIISYHKDWKRWLGGSVVE